MVPFDSFGDAMAFGLEAALADGIVKKLLSPIAWPLPQHFREIRPACPDGMSLLVAMVAEPSLESFKALLGTARHDHAGAADRATRPARCRSTNIPGTTRPCRC